MTLRGQISWAFLSILLFSLGGRAQGLAQDEIGPTAAEAVSVGTMDENFLLPTYSLPASSEKAETPQASVYSIPDEIDILSEIFGKEAITLNDSSDSKVTIPAQSTPAQPKTFTPTTQGKVNTKPTLLTPLSPLPEPMVFEEEEVPPYTPFIHQADYANQALGAMKNKTNLKFTMPREIRVTFYPDQAVFSAQILKWVKAFSLKTLSDPRYQIEIRASSINWPLQSKRVALLVHEIMAQGVSKHQIKVYQTERDENSVMLGCVLALDKSTQVEQHKKGNKQKTLTW